MKKSIDRKRRDRFPNGRVKTESHERKKEKEREENNEFKKRNEETHVRIEKLRQWRGGAEVEREREKRKRKINKKKRSNIEERLVRFIFIMSSKRL